MDRPGRIRLALGYLQIHGQGGCFAEELRDLLEAFEQAYAAVVAVEIAAARVVAEHERLREWGPPHRYWSIGYAGGARLEIGEPAQPLIVSRVQLSSPGFWEFLGRLNPLEVLRLYLNDRHERQKDHDYRSAAEADALALDNAIKRLDVIRQIANLEQNYGPEVFQSEAWRQGWLGDVQGPLRRLAQFDDRGLIDGQTAQTSSERPEPPQLSAGPD